MYPIFLRLASDNEIEVMKNNTIKELEDIKEYDEKLYGLVKRSVYNNEPCIYGYYWWELGYGSNLNDLSLSSNSSFIYYSIKNKVYLEVNDFYNVFQFKVKKFWCITSYKRKKVKSYKQLKNYLRKDFYKLSLETKLSLREFWNKYPRGIVYFAD